MTLRLESQAAKYIPLGEYAQSVIAPLCSSVVLGLKLEPFNRNI